jgi:hypothetical protein
MIIVLYSLESLKTISLVFLKSASTHNFFWAGNDRREDKVLSSNFTAGTEGIGAQAYCPVRWAAANSARAAATCGFKEALFNNMIPEAVPRA